MQKIEDIRIEEYNYPLPDQRIAKYPLTERDQSKLLVYQEGVIREERFGSLPQLLPSHSLMVFNNTKVIQARLHFRKETGALIEVFCLEPHLPSDYALSFESRGHCSWHCMVGNLKKWKEGTLRQLLVINDTPITLAATRVGSEREMQQIAFEWDNEQVSFATILEHLGELPIPPYLNRETEENDKSTYQTVYSKIEGSVAAPTAGLHFTPTVLAELAARDIQPLELTLHVGAGTFRPVKSERIAGHTMHTEHISVERSLIECLMTNLDRVIAVGTTSVRTLESLYYIGSTLYHNPHAEGDELVVKQWQPYREVYTLSTQEALQAIVDHLEREGLDRLVTATQIMIAPSYTFRIVKGIVTNFHQPQSTLLLLVSAFVGEDWHTIYDYALGHDFRFLSYGDSSLLLPKAIK